MKKDDLLKIANYFREKTQELIRYSSNIPDLHKQPFHRRFWLRAMRAKNDKFGIRKKILGWHMNLKADQVPDSFQYRKVSGTFFSKNKSKKVALNQFFNFFGQHKNEMGSHKDGKKFSTLEKIELAAKNAVKFGIGNCNENSDTTFTLLLEYPKNGIPELGLPPIDNEEILMESVHINTPDGGDHCFVVLNRNQRGHCSLNAMNTWRDAIILDPWMNDVVDIELERVLPEELRSHCFKYISQYENDLKRLEFGYIGEGHSLRWIDHRTKKNEPVNLRDWTPYYTQENFEQENVPWVDDEKEIIYPPKKRPRQ